MALRQRRLDRLPDEVTVVVVVDDDADAHGTRRWRVRQWERSDLAFRKFSAIARAAGVCACFSCKKHPRECNDA
jgi:hypothetical protein